MSDKTNWRLAKLQRACVRIELERCQTVDDLLHLSERTGYDLLKHLNADDDATDTVAD